MTALVFLRPTLARRDAEQLIDAVMLPPAQQGDVFRAVHVHRPAAIGLIDGAFAEARPVWHREILWAMSQGVHVFGAASMGALRAVELARELLVVDPAHPLDVRRPVGEQVFELAAADEADAELRRCVGGRMKPPRSTTPP